MLNLDSYREIKNIFSQNDNLPVKNITKDNKYKKYFDKYFDKTKKNGVYYYTGCEKFKNKKIKNYKIILRIKIMNEKNISEFSLNNISYETLDNYICSLEQKGFKIKKYLPKAILMSLSL